MRSVRIAGMRTTIRNRPFLKAGEELYLRIMKIDPARTAKTTVAQQLAEQATNKTVRTWDQIVPTHYHEHAKVFSKEAAHRFPESCNRFKTGHPKYNGLQSLPPVPD